MSTDFEKTLRLATRAELLAQRPNLPAAVKIVLDEVVPVAQNFKTANTNVRLAVSTMGKEMREADAALKAFHRDFDGAREVLILKAPHEPVGGAASQYSTGTDLLNQAENMEDSFTRYAGQPWADAILATFSPALDRAAKEATEGVTASDDHQKALETRRIAQEQLLGILVNLRRSLRAAYGSKSREYRSFKVVRRSGEGEESLPEEDETQKK